MNNRKILVIANILLFLFIGILFIKTKTAIQTPISALTSKLTMGQIELVINNPKDMQDFYSMLGLQTLEKKGNVIQMGYNNNRIITLINNPSLPPPSPTGPGLDQIAIVYDSKAGLAQAVNTVLNKSPQNFVSGVDRKIDQSFYVVDPQGNSLELYYDTNPDTWNRTVKGNIEFDSQPLDVQQFIRENSSTPGSKGMQIGHIQIRAGDLSLAEQFYVNTIGFYKIPSLVNTNLMLSDGFYHHNLVVDPWQPGGIPMKTLGLEGFTLIIKNDDDMQQLKNRLSLSKINFESNNGGIVFDDPWGTEVYVQVAQKQWWSMFSDFFRSFI